MILLPVMLVSTRKEIICTVSFLSFDWNVEMVQANEPFFLEDVYMSSNLSLSYVKDLMKENNRMAENSVKNGVDLM